jgi:hypothetical protein
MSNLQSRKAPAKGSLFQGQPIDEVIIEEVALAKQPLNKKVFHLMMEGGSMIKDFVAKIKAGEYKLPELFAALKAEGVEIPVEDNSDPAKIKAEADAKAKADAEAKLKADKEAKAKAEADAAKLEAEKEKGTATIIPPEVQLKLDKLEAESKTNRETIAALLLERKGEQIDVKLEKLHVAMDKKKLRDLWVAAEATGQLPAFEELLTSYDGAVKVMFETKGLPAGEANTEQAAMKKLSALALEGKTDLMTAARANPALAAEAGMVPKMGGN